MERDFKEFICERDGGVISGRLHPRNSKFVKQGTLLTIFILSLASLRFMKLKSRYLRDARREIQSRFLMLRSLYPRSQICKLDRFSKLRRIFSSYGSD